MNHLLSAAATFDTSWWEYLRDEDGALKMSPFLDNVSSPILRNLATGEERRARELPIGALYALDRSDCRGPNDWPRAGADGLAIACRTADHTWYIEGRASNCTKPDEPHHRCWVRQGTVGGLLTVDKNGPTCAAGAGSFFMGREREWHGFLDKGKLTPQRTP